MNSLETNSAKWYRLRFRLSRINDNLARKIASRTEYDKTITETEGAYQKVRQVARNVSLGARVAAPVYVLAVTA